MTTKDTRAEDRQALVRLLEIYGADRTRWPARERLRFAGFISEDDDARRAMVEAAALERLLDLAPKASSTREQALKERIVAAALRSAEPRLAVVTRGSDGAAWRPRAASAARAAWARLPSLAGAPASSGWAAAELLAASLFVGVLLGSAGTFDTTVQQVAEATGYAVSADSSQLALGEEMVAAADEDLL